MIFKQFYLNCLAQASYLIGDERAGVAAVVDPQRDVDQYLALARAHGLEIRHVLLTHLHADFIAGHLELRAATGATIYLGARARAEYAFTPLGDGDSVEFGSVRLRAIETPGHTPESISIEVFDLDRSASVPSAVLTGDTLFVGDVGRPDLRAALGWSAADLGALLYDSLRTRLMALPDEVLVYPAHGAGSLCGKALSKETVSTIGEQRRVNYALQPMSKDAFVSLVTADQPDAPPYFTYDAVLNSKERPTLTQALEAGLRPLTIDDVVAVQKSGGQVLDTRAPEDFDAAHLIGSINVGLRGQYATWAGTVLDREHPIAIIADPGFEQESAVRLGRIGFDHIAGYLAGGLASLAASTRAAGVAADLKVRPTYGEGAAGVAADLKVRPTYDELVTSTERISAERAAAWMGTGEPVLLDVRTPAEHAAGHIDGSVNIPLSQLAARVGELPQERPILLYCAGGYRSAIAASLLQRHGRARVSEIAGGFAAWEARRAAINLPSAND